MRVLLTAVALQSPLVALPLRFLAWDDDIAVRSVSVTNNGKINALEDLHPYKRSKVFDVTIGETPLLLVASDRKNADGKPATVEIKITAGISSPLVIILPDPKHPGGLRPFVIEDSQKTFSWGSLRFVNATGKELLFRCDKSVISLPGSWNPLDFAPGGASRNMMVQIAAKDNLKALLYTAVWEHNPDIRNLVLILPGANPASAVVNLKTIPEDRRIIAMEAVSKKP